MTVWQVDRRDPAVRPRLHDHARRPARRDADDRLLPVGDGVQEPRVRLRLGGRLRAVRGDAGHHRSASSSTPGARRWRRSDGGPDASRTPRPRHARRHPARVAPPRRPPLSRWHFLLAPVALLFAAAVRADVPHVAHAGAEINKFPPRLIPPSLHARRLRRVCSPESDILRWLLNTAIVSTVAVVVAPGAVLAGRLRLRPAEVRRSHARLLR